MSDDNSSFSRVSRWRFVFKTLSLCSAEPFFDDMGLNIKFKP